MRLNPTKTSIGFHEMEFLGFTVSDKGISISPSKMEAIKRISPPSNRKSLQKLIGLAQYFRRYMPNFSTKIANMRQLLKKGPKVPLDRKLPARIKPLKEAFIGGTNFAAH